jgi:acyl-coenzyme A thioesterase PaaI-like protein
VPDFDAIKALMPQLVPFVATLKIEYGQLDGTTAVCVLRDEPAFHNHVGGLHAGAMFTLAETASGALVIGNFEDLIATGVTPLAATATIDYTRLAKGDVTATAVLGRPAAEIRAELAETGRTTQFPVAVTLGTADGETARMTISWALRPPR